jgi:hypothetical protein
MSHVAAPGTDALRGAAVPGAVPGRSELRQLEVPDHSGAPGYRALLRPGRAHSTGLALEMSENRRLSNNRTFRSSDGLRRRPGWAQSGLFRISCLMALEMLPFGQDTMTLKQARDLIQTCVGQMNARYQKVVFDEWAIIALSDKRGVLLAYVGPRKEGFQQNFLSDAGSLRAGLLAHKYDVGDFEFARHGVGTGFESFMVLGEGIYLICNNTVQSMDGIAKDPRWIGAQVPFVELSDQFRDDPMLVSSQK